MGKRILEITGTDGQIELLTDRVIIHRRGIWNMFKHGINARREIPIASISSINFRDANMLRMGEIDFDYAGRSQIDRKQNTVMFAKRQQKAFLDLKERLFDLMQQQPRR